MNRSRINHHSTRRGPLRGQVLGHPRIRQGASLRSARSAAAALTDPPGGPSSGICVMAGEAVSIARCRALLGDEARGLSDHEVDTVRRHADTMAHVLIEVLLMSTPETPG